MAQQFTPAAYRISAAVAAAALAVTFAAAFAPAALAQSIGQAPQGAPAVPPTHSVEQADARLADVARNRAAMEAEFRASEKVCSTRFFVNNCLDQAKEKRRITQAGLRAVEVEANYFKRKFAVDQRDRELAERVTKDEAEMARRVETPPVPHTERAAPRPPAKGPSLEQRQAAHDARVTAQQAKEAAEAPKRAKSEAAFEKKKADAAKRQAEVAAKKTAKEEKLRKREADAAAKAK